MIIRPEKAGDIKQIHGILMACFPESSEARLVDRLRFDGDMEFALVASNGTAVVGFVALSRMKAPFRALGLAPVAVAPSHRQQGIAARLIWRALAEAKEGGWQGIFLLGEPAYYRRFGFSAKSAEGFLTQYAGPNLMVLALQGNELPETSGSISYASAFADI